MMPLSYCKTYCESRPVFLGSVPRASSIRGLSRGVVSGQRIAQHDWTRPSITDGLECNCRRRRKQRLPAHRSEEKLARVFIGSVGVRELRMERKAIARETRQKPKMMDERYLPALAHWWGRRAS
jgi:hypothetical protein